MINQRIDVPRYDSRAVFGFRGQAAGMPRSTFTGGFSLSEILIVLAIVGTLAGVGFVFGRQILQGQQNRSAINTVQQSVWQGATAAASRGITAELFRNGRVLQVRNQATS
ncbi:MAG: prepilin-type N-terminal cleavage/methylation domain-containing protein, partial [Fimbriimonadaceae bacterium]|nr:prepilin-type N-terminal cleavage/methylation domain-containing protein [Fimbriimonadaceae bacterium]